jgi:hypothetical protein
MSEKIRFREAGRRYTQDWMWNDWQSNGASCERITASVVAYIADMQEMQLTLMRTMRSLLSMIQRNTAKPKPRKKRKVKKP